MTATEKKRTLDALAAAKAEIADLTNLADALVRLGRCVDAASIRRDVAERQIAVDKLVTTFHERQKA